MTDDSPKPVTLTQAIPKSDSQLQDGLIKEVIEQPTRMDELAKQLITLELAVPGAYVTALKLIHGEDTKLGGIDPVLWFTFGCWLVALLLTLFSLLPRKWEVDRKLFRRTRPAAKGEALSIEEFFTRTASYKRWLLIYACILFFFGILAAALSIS